MTVNCHICGQPMIVDAEPNEFVTAETISKLATCETCCARREGRKPDYRNPQQQRPLPYKDE